MSHAPRNSPGAIAAKKAVATDKVVEVKGAKNGEKRTIPAQKASRFYPAEDIPRPKVSRKAAQKTSIRSTITPGTVVILLAGRHSGKRVVVLKQLDSGLLLITGPYKINGVPLRRVNQAYVIATSTKLDITEVKLDDKINDTYFKKSAKVDKAFLQGEEKKAAFPASKAADQKAVDNALLKIVAKTPVLRQYLASSFGLNKGQFPHAMKF